MLTWVEINSAAIKYNLAQFRHLIGPNTLLMPVVKANAYGHGLFEVTKICNNSKVVDKICVVNLDEALSLLSIKPKKDLLVISFYDLDEHKLCSSIKHNIILPIYDITQAHLINKVASKLNKKARVHIKLDTGATRIGITPSEISKFILQLKKFKYIKPEGVFSHFASSETDRIYTNNQIDVFNEMIDEIRQGGIEPDIRHAACTAASVLHPNSRDNAVRLGLGMYGLYPDELSKKIIKLRPALSWFTTIIQVKSVPAWTKIGYGGTFTTKKATKLAILPIGYWDGYPRALSNKGHVIINGKRCPIRGRICMNLCMVDVTGIKKVKAGDKAMLIGHKNKAVITADDLASWANTINYEIVDRINPLIPRLLV